MTKQEAEAQGKRSVAALFVRRDSIYKALPGVECYDEWRDARTFPGGMPVVAHPPCRTWGTLAHWAKAPEAEHGLALWAVQQVRQWGGVLEHPATSGLWREGHLAAPTALRLPDEYGGWTLECDQFHWGHLAQKRTRLYIVGTKQTPPIPFRDGEPTHCVSSLSGKRVSAEERHRSPKYKPELGPNRRDKTPPEFARWLIAIARLTDVPEREKAQGIE